MVKIIDGEICAGTQREGRANNRCLRLSDRTPCPCILQMTTRGCSRHSGGRQQLPARQRNCLPLAAPGLLQTGARSSIGASRL